MATPGAPANFTARPGPHPGSIYVKADAVVADPTVDHYTIYVDDATGVSASQFRHAFRIGNPANFIQGLSKFNNYFVTLTATNSEAEGSGATEIKVRGDTIDL